LGLYAPLPEREGRVYEVHVGVHRLPGEGRGSVRLALLLVGQLLGHLPVFLGLGTVYSWRPESVVVECDCGERATLTASRTACGECGADQEAATEEVLDVRQQDKIEHPWRSVRPYYAPTRGT
jgi:hypothetical protein